MRINLIDFNGNSNGFVDWNPETGELAGPGAAAVQFAADQAVKNGWISTRPIPSEIEATDPLKSRREFAALIGWAWELPEELANDYPVIEDEYEGEQPEGIVF